MSRARAVEATTGPGIDRRWTTARTLAELLCRDAHNARDVLRAVGNRSLRKCQKTMHGTETIHAGRLPIETVAAVCEISG
jgi:hypothetical protein